MSYFGVSTRNGVGLGLGTVPSLTNTPLSYRLAPSLNLSFAGSDALSPAITFSRTTNATLTNSAGLVANAPMNLLTFSEQFDNAAWSKTNATVAANTTEAPNGTLTADTMTATAANGTLRNDPAKSGEITNSIYVKRKTGTGGVQILDATGTYRTITVTSEWTRVSYTATAASASLFGIRLSVSGDEIYVWGAQSENSSTATTYNPTTVKNLLGFTENFDNAAWTKSNAFVQTNLLAFSAFNAIGTSPTTNAWYETSAALDTTVNSAIAPDGTQTAALLAINSATSFAAVFQVPTTATANTYAYSVYCKAASTDTTCRLLLSGDASVANFVRANFTLSGAGSASVADVSGTAVSAATPTIQAVGDGWYRCTIAGTLTAPTSTRVLVYPGNPGAQTTASQTLVWGAQLVQGTSAGDYKATYAAAAAVGYTDIYGQPFAQKLVEDTVNGVHRFFNNVAVVVSSVGPSAYTLYAKAGERTAVRFTDNDLQGADFDLLTGAVSNIGSGVTAATTSVGNGWWRLFIARTSSTGSGRIVLNLLSGGTTSYTGDGTSGIYIFGAQLSDSASVDPYVYNPVAAPSSVAYYGPRFDYDPVTLAPKGLLIEEQRTNLITYSEQFDNAAWVKSETTVTPSTAVAPDGSLTADKAVPTTSSSSHSMYLAVAVTAGITYTGTYYVKAAGLNFLQLTGGAAGFGTSQYANFDLQNGVLGTVTGGTATITSAGNGWYRCSFTVACVTPSSVGVIPIFVTSATAPRAEVFAGDGTSGLFLWGAQLEAGAFATSYIPTVASQVTRAADSASMIGNNFARWYTQGPGTVYAEFLLNSTAGTFPSAYSINDGTTNNRIQPYQNSALTSIGFDITTGGAAQAAINITVPSLATAYVRHAGAYQTNSAVAAANGTLGTEDTSVTLATYNRLGLGSNALAQNANCWIKRFAYYNRRLSNTELQGITS